MSAPAFLVPPARFACCHARRLPPARGDRAGREDEARKGP